MITVVSFNETPDDRGPERVPDRDRAVPCSRNDTIRDIMTALISSHRVAPARSNFERVFAVDSRPSLHTQRSLRKSTGNLEAQAVRARLVPRFTRSVCRAAVDYNQAPAGVDHSYSPEVSQLLPANFDLGLDLGNPDCLSGCLDPVKLAKAGNALSTLWSECRLLAEIKLAVLPLAARRAASPESGTGQHILQCSLFCSGLVEPYQPFRSGGQHADFYALACLCLKVCDVLNTGHGFTLRHPLALSNLSV